MVDVNQPGAIISPFKVKLTTSFLFFLNLPGTVSPQ